MDESEALKLLGITTTIDHLTPSILRKHYLRAALRSHPDKNPQDKIESSQRFARIQEAYSLLVDKHTTAAVAATEKAHTRDILGVFLRAMRGENVETDLKNLRVYRPPPLFGIDLSVPFYQKNPVTAAASPRQRPPPPLPDADVDVEVEPIDIHQVFTEALRDEGLDVEGNPLEGWARSPTDDSSY